MSQSAWNPGAGGPQQPQAYPPSPAPSPQGYPAQPPQGYPAQPPQPFAAQVPGMPLAGLGPEAAKSFITGLIDFSFNSFVAPKVMKVIYGLWLVAVGLGMLASFYAGFDRAFLASYNNVGEGLLQIILAPLAGAVAVVVGRVYVEVLIVLFRIAENLTEMNRKMPAPNQPPR